VLANVCNEYIDFGNEVFKEGNEFKAIFLSTDNGHMVAKPVYNLLLCIICESDANLGLIRTKVRDGVMVDRPAGRGTKRRDETLGKPPS